MIKKTTREFSGNCILFPESPYKLFRLFGDTGKGTLCQEKKPCAIWSAPYSVLHGCVGFRVDGFGRWGGKMAMRDLRGDVCEGGWGEN